MENDCLATEVAMQKNTMAGSKAAKKSTTNPKHRDSAWLMNVRCDGGNGVGMCRDSDGQVRKDVLNKIRHSKCTELVHQKHTEPVLLECTELVP